MNFLKHLAVVNHHRRLVRKHCFQCGLFYQGLVHDLSKYSKVEFRNGVTFFRGNGSPHFNERTTKGYSESWMHHKGRNKHHCEYWTDFNYQTKKYEPIEMPRKYVAEMLCDRIAASKTYNKKTYTESFALEYYLKEEPFLVMHENTKKDIEMLLTMVKEKGEKYTFKYVRKVYLKNKHD